MNCRTSEGKTIINTGYPYNGFEDMYAQAETTPEWYGFGHKHLVYQTTPVKHLILADGQEHSEIDVEDPQEPLDHIVADQLRGYPAERHPLPVSALLTLVPTIRPGARPDMEYGQFQHPDTRPAVIGHGLRIDPLANPTSGSNFFQRLAGTQGYATGFQQYQQNSPVPKRKRRWWWGGH